MDCGKLDTAEKKMKLTKIICIVLFLSVFGCSTDNYIDPCPSNGCFNDGFSELHPPKDMMLDGFGFEVKSLFTSKYVDYFSVENENFEFIVKNYKPPVNSSKSSWINTGVVSGKSFKSLLLQDYLYDVMLRNNINFKKCETNKFTKFDVTVKENYIDVQKKCGDDVVVEKYPSIKLSGKEIFLINYLLIDFFNEYKHCIKKPKQCLDIQK